jgi:hypothetical protein
MIRRSEIANWPVYDTEVEYQYELQTQINENEALRLKIARLENHIISADKEVEFLKRELGKPVAS